MTKRFLCLLLSLVLFATLMACGAPKPKPAGNRTVKLSSYEQEIQRSLDALKQNPDSVSTLTNLGRAYFHLGNYDKASEALLHATEIEPYPMASFYLGLSTIARGDREAGFELLKKFRYSGNTQITQSVRTAATNLAADPTATTEKITNTMITAWDAGQKKAIAADRPEK